MRQRLAAVLRGVRRRWPYVLVLALVLYLIAPQVDQSCGRLVLYSATTRWTLASIGSSGIGGLERPTPGPYHVCPN